MTPVEIAKKLNANPDLVVNHLFKGAATFKGGRWSIGNIDGEPGESFVIYKNSGRYKDFADAKETGGDLLELLSKKYGSKAEGIKVAHELLGIPMVNRSTSTSAKSEGKIVKWEKPEKDWTQLTEKDNPAVIKYLVEERKIPLEVLKHAGVKAKDNEWYVFIRKTHDEKPIPCGSFYININRKEIDGKQKKIIHQSQSPLDTLYGHDTCKRGIEKNGKTFIVITGGQIDMLSYRSVGVMNSVSIPAGEATMKWTEASWDFLKEFQEIYIHLDNDATGIKMTDKVAQKLGYERCHRCILPPYYKDANEALVKGYDLQQAINNAVDFRPDMLVSAGEIMDGAMAILGNGRREDQGIPFLGWEEDESVNFRIRPREMTLITGVPNHGKSSILYQQVAFLVFCKKEKCFIASLEEDPEVILGLIATQALATQHNVNDKKNFRAFMEVMKELDEYVWFYNYRGRAKADDVLAKAEYVIRKHDVKHVIFDSVAKTDLNIENNEQCNEFVGKICKSMNETGAHYYCVAHPRKGDGKTKGYDAIVGIDEVKGSAALGIETFNGFTVWKNEAKAVMLKAAQKSGTGMFTSRKYKDSNGEQRRITEEDILSKGDGVLSIWKQKVGGKTGRFDMWYNPYCYRLERNSHAVSVPYAMDIYNEYIADKVITPPAF